MEQSGQSLAVTAESLYLVNLMLAPGLAFIILLLLFQIKKKQLTPLAANHFSQTIGVSVVGGVLLVCISASLALLGGPDSGYTWMVVILYFTFIHSSLILMGVIGLVKALNGQHFRYPLVGRMFQS